MDVMSHVGWSNPKTALYYIKLADVIRAGAPSHILSSNMSSYQFPTGHRYESAFTRSFLAGSYTFQPDEVEVFYETT